MVNIALPALRERQEDIPLLVKRFIDQFASENGKKIESITPEALDILGHYNWPGNIRELRNCIERMVVLSRNDLLDIIDVPSNIKAAVELHVSSQISMSGDMTVGEQEKALIIKTLKECNNNRTLAAEKLGLSRRTLYRRLEQYGLEQ